MRRKMGALVGFAVDTAKLYLVKIRLQRALDAAVADHLRLAGAAVVDPEIVMIGPGDRIPGKDDRIVRLAAGRDQCGRGQGYGEVQGAAPGTGHLVGGDGPVHVVFSAHSLPLKIVERGDRTGATRRRFHFHHVVTSRKSLVQHTAYHETVHTIIFVHTCAFAPSRAR